LKLNQKKNPREKGTRLKGVWVEVAGAGRGVRFGVGGEVGRFGNRGTLLSRGFALGKYLGQVQWPVQQNLRSPYMSI
jgi:hypothetical protein